MNREKIANLLNGLKMWQKVVIAFVFVGVIVLLLTLNRPNNLEVLYTNLSSGDSDAIRNALNVAKIDFKEINNGKTTTIEVNKQDVGTATTLLADKGLPKDTSVGYELFNNSSMFTSEAQQQVQYKYTTINEIQKKLKDSFSSFINDATVSLDFQQGNNLWQNGKKASATVNVQVRNGGMLTDEEVKSIQYMVAGNLVDLKSSDIMVTDGNGNTYDNTSSDNYQGASGYSKQQQVVNETEQRISSDLRKTLNQTLQPQNYTLNLRVDIDFNQVVKKIETVDPKGTLISKDEKKSSTTSTDGSSQQQPGTASNGTVPDYQQSTNGSNVTNKQDQSENIENYEVGKIEETIKQNPEVTKTYVTVTINKDAVDKDILAANLQQYTGDWQSLLANAAGIDIGPNQTFKNGNVVVQVKDYATRTNNPAKDSGESADLNSGGLNQQTVRNASIFVAIGLILFVLFMVFVPKALPGVGKKNKKKSNFDGETEISMKAKEENMGEKQDRIVTQPSIQSEIVSENEKMRELKEGKSASNMQKQYTEEIYRLADDNPQKTAEYLKTKIKEG